jgi:hypothetical protein
MEEKKLFARLCPKCGKLCQTAEPTPINLGAGVQYNMQCEDGHKWSEFYCLTYTGYWWDGKKYDTYGEEVTI